MDFKDTLLMPQTAFKMKAGLVNNEPVSQEAWRKNKIYEQRNELNKGNEQFVLHDGPPYANGNLHVGHALNKILKDFVVRSKSMQGYYSPYIPGWDTHGLPIEQVITNSGVDRKQYSVSEFREMCEKYALEQIEIQKKSFQEYNLLGDWDNPYATLHKSFEASQIEVFAKMVERGLIFKGLRPVYWSPSSESALAEAEIEYRDKKSPAIYVKFPAVNGFKSYDNLSFVIWTTTPWTLPANLAIALGKEIDYAVVKVGAEHLVVGYELVEKLMSLFAFESYEVVGKYKGSEFEGCTYEHVFMNRTSPIIFGEHVSVESGTALVHTAPGHGEDDFKIGKEYGLDILCPVNDSGILTSDAGMFAGLVTDDANKAIVQHLEEIGKLLHFEMITHSYPHDWRTKKPVLFRTTAQWFASIDKIRENILNEIDNGITWYPSWGRTRLYNMIKDRGDWCISRQRVWGVPIPVFYDETGKEILDHNVMMHISRLFEEHGSNIWFSWDATDLLPEGYTHPNSPNNKFTKETDIMDVWFDSGSSHNAVFKKYGITYPCQLYLEGSDQYRGWFNSSLITGVAINDRSPYENIVSHGFILDSKGYAMSKSLGNVINPKDLINQFGADILRLWVATVDYQQDARISVEAMKQSSESYRKIRNTFRYLDGNTSTVTSMDDLLDVNSLEHIDKYMITRLNEYITTVTNYYNEFEYQNIFKETMKFVNFISSFYFEYAKDSLYADSISSKHRLSIQTVLYNIKISMLKLLTPILPHTTDELYTLSTSIFDKKQSIYLENFPSVIEIEETDYKDVELLLDIRKDVLKAMEVAREEGLIGKSLEAKATISLSESDASLIENVGDLKELFVCSKVIVTTEKLDLVEKYGVLIEKMDGTVCPRCWNIYENIEELCPRCESVMGEKEV